MEKKTAAAVAVIAILVAVAIGWGLFALVGWLRPQVVEPDPMDTVVARAADPIREAALRRGLLARSQAPSDEEEVSAVPPDHPFANIKIRGRVLDAATREGIAGAVVRVRPTYGEPALGPADGDGSVSFVTRDGGAFALRGVPPGDFEIDVAASGYMPAKMSFRKFNTVEDDEGFEFELDRASVIEGRAVNPRGEPVSGVRVVAVAAGQALVSAQAPSAISGDDGRFVLDPVPVDSVVLLGTHPAFAPTRVEVPRSERPVRPAELVMGAGQRIAGIVRGPDGPIPGADVGLQVLPGQGRSLYFARKVEGFGVTTGPDGRYELTAPASGSMTLRARATGYRSATKRLLLRAAEGEATIVDFTLEPGTAFAGRVLQHDGQVAVRARVVVSTDNGGHGDTETGTDGRFLVRGLPPHGPYEVVVRHHTHPPLMVREASLGAEREYVLEPPARIVGRVSDARTGAPITRYAYRLSGPLRMRNHAVSLSGALEIDQLAPGTYELEVRAEGYVEAVIDDIVVSTGDKIEGLDIRLAPGASILGQVVGGAEGEILVQAFAEQEGRLEFRNGALAGPEGQFEISELREGVYTLLAMGAGQRGQVRGISLGAGQSLGNVAIEMNPPSGPE